jgi:hypothetical protein
MNTKGKFNLRDHLENLLSSYNPERVFEILDQYATENQTVETQELIQIKSRFARVQQRLQSGILSPNDFDLDVNRIVYDLQSWLKDNIDKKTSWCSSEISSEEDLDLSLQDLKDQLIEILNFNSIEPVFYYLKKLVFSTKLKFQLDQIKEKYELFEWERTNKRSKDKIGKHQDIKGMLDEEEAERQNIQQQREEFIKRIKELINNIKEGQLSNNWRFDYLEIKQNFKYEEKNRPKTILISPLDIIEIPDYLSKYDDYKTYKRLMIRAQDAYLAEEYDEAYDLYIKVRNEVDPESSQLYEYLFITYFYKVGVDEIIDMALDQEKGDRHLKRLFLYAARFARLQSIASSKEGSNPKELWGANKIAYRKKDIHSSTGDFNIKAINNELLLALADRYTRIAEGRRGLIAHLKKSQINRIRMCLTIAGSITEHIRVDAVFATTVINELAGGGKHLWIAVNPHGKLTNTEKTFDALDQFANAVRLLGFGREEDREKTEEKLAINLLNTLTAKYNKLKSSKDQKLSDKSRRLIVTKLLVSFRVATLLFPRQSTLFTNLPLEELRNNDSIHDWYTLHPGRELRPIAPKLEGIYFDALEFHRYFLHIHTLGDENQADQWKTEEERIIGIYYHKLRAAAEEQEAFIRSQRYKVDPISPDTDFLNKVVSCYEKWQICYDVYQEVIFLQKSFDELVGNHTFFWYLLERSGFQNLAICKELSPPFDAKNELEKLVEERQFTDMPTANRSIAVNYFHRFLKFRISAISATVRKNPYPSPEYKRDLLDCLKEIIKLCKVAGPLAEFGNVLYEELVEEYTIKWLDIRDGAFVAIDQKNKHLLESVSVLMAALKLFQHIDSFSVKKVQRRIAKNRLREIAESYEVEFNRHQRKNDHPDEIVKMVEIVETLVGYYKVIGDKKYLEIPYSELVKGKGRIHWSNPGLGFESLIPFRITYDRFKPRWQIRMVSEFNYSEMRRYVKSEFEKKENDNATTPPPAKLEPAMEPIGS